MSTATRPQLTDSLGYLLKHAHLQLVAEADARLAPLGIDARELGVLIAIAAADAQSQQQVAQRMHVDRTTMVAVLDALESKGIVSRRPDPDDRRRNVVELTADGAGVFERALVVRDAVEREYLGPVSDRDGRQLRRVLTTLVERGARG